MNEQNPPDVAPIPNHSFGGKWTSEKLVRLEKYLRAYVRVMSRQRQFRTLYIDAFAGSGWISRKDEQDPSQIFLPEFADEFAERFIEGSARIALQVEPPFYRYIFVEKNAKRARELEGLKTQFRARADSIIVRREEANVYLQHLCAKTPWTSYRAVLFLDPYGMQVQWKTLEMIAATGAIDVWYLFPLGIGVNRLLKTNGQINEANAAKVTEMFGTDEWRGVFFTPSQQEDLFPHGEHADKKANFEAIESFFISRLKTIFPTVAEKPARMLNSRGNPLYLLCFAAANGGRGGDIAIKIANHILKQKYGR